jgi:hypothetical protein
LKTLVLCTCAAIATLALASCGSGNSSQKTMEYKLASIDGQPSAEKQYGTLLDELDPKCQEDRDSLGDMTVKAVELIKQADKQANNLQMLQALQAAARSATASTPVKCGELYAAIVTSIQTK